MALVNIEIDGNPTQVDSSQTVMDAARSLGIRIPHFCYHRKLSIAANCRMCLVEVEKVPKPLPACATFATEGMKVKTHSPFAVKAQTSVMEFLLRNHPLDCPICDHGGECKLQDESVGYGLPYWALSGAFISSAPCGPSCCAAAVQLRPLAASFFTISCVRQQRTIQSTFLATPMRLLSFALLAAQAFAFSDFGAQQPFDSDVHGTATPDYELKLQLNSLGADEFTHLSHPRFPAHSARIKRSNFCDGEVK